MVLNLCSATPAFLICTYVDDLAIAVPETSMVSDILAMLRQRFVIEEGEGRPIDFLLGIAIRQDLKAGTISMDMSTSRKPVCHLWGFVTCNGFCQSDSECLERAARGL